MRLIAVKNSTSSKKQYGWIVRDLGTLYPDVLAVKLFMSKSSSNATTNYYQAFIGSSASRMISMSSVTDFSTIGAGQYPLGFTRCCGPSGIYSQYLVLSIAYDVRISLHPDFSDLPEGTAGTGYERQFPPWLHMSIQESHAVSNYVQSNSTQDSVDNIRCQPSMHKQWTPGWANGITTAAASTPVAGYTEAEPRSLRWRGVMWPHRVKKQPFTAYLGAADSWHAYDYDWTTDTTSTKVGISGAALSHKSTDTTALATRHRVFITVDSCASFLFRTANAALT